MKASKQPRDIEALSELVKIVFGLALSIGAISLISRLPAKPDRIVIDIIEFGFSFLILISVWWGYTHIVSVLPMEDNLTVALNLMLLFLVSIEPYLFYLNITFDLMAHELMLNYASMLYALDMTGLMAILGLFTHQLASEESGLASKEAMIRFERVRNILFISAALFAVTILPTFWTLKLGNVPVRIYLWIVPLLLSFFSGISERKFQE